MAVIVGLLFPVCWLLVLSVVLFVVWDLHRKKHLFKFAREFNGYRFYPIIGNGYHFIGQNIYTSMRKLVRKFRLPCSTWIGHEYFYTTADAAEIKVVLNHPGAYEKSSFYEVLRFLFGNTLLMAEVNVWKKNRKIFARSFSQPILNGFVNTFFTKSCILVDVLKRKEDPNYESFDRFSLDNFCANLMNLDLDIQLNADSELMHIGHRIQEVLGHRIVTSLFYPERIWWYSSEGKSTWKDFLRLQEIIYDIIKKKRQAFEENKDCKDDPKKHLMDMMLEAEGITFTDDEIFREIFLFLLAATDTSGGSLSFTFTLLGMNPEIQEKVYKEVIDQVGIDGHILHSDLPNLKYTEQALFESMRLLPVIPHIGRRVTTDIDLGSKILPAGSSIIISILDLHRSEAYWKDPLKYNPDRFANEEGLERDPYAFIPFSSGPRNCIDRIVIQRMIIQWLDGAAFVHINLHLLRVYYQMEKVYHLGIRFKARMKYAIMMMKTAVAHVVRNFRIESNYKSIEDLELMSAVSMRTVQRQLNCKFIPRNT